MIDWLIEVNDKCRSIAEKAHDGLAALERDDEAADELAQRYMKADYQALVATWEKVNPDKKKSGRLGVMARHIRFGEKQDYADIIKHDIPDVQQCAEKLVKESQQEPAPLGFEALLHPVIIEKTLPLFMDGHLREAVLNSVIAVFDMIRQRTGLNLDGKDLVGRAFGMDNGILGFSELHSETGKNDQAGVLQIYNGIYQGVRNVKSHSLTHDLNQLKAAQYLVMMSLLARRVEECYVR